ncbi:hypothetical protein [Acinetobacter thutiue]|nr:hypothetical protein [Acinetobacter thutiue]
MQTRHETQGRVNPLVKFHNEVWGGFSHNPAGQGHFLPLLRYVLLT